MLPNQIFLTAVVLGPFTLVYLSLGKSSSERDDVVFSLKEEGDFAGLVT